MRIVNFNKAKRRKQPIKRKRRIKAKELLVIAAAVVALLSAIVWLIRDVSEVGRAFGPAEGALIVNINTASEAELVSVPGLGPSRAAQVIAGRPYESVDDLEKIAGIAGKTLESLRPFVTVDGETRMRK